MKCVHADVISNTAPEIPGYRVMAIILADEAPASLEITGADVDGLDDEAVIAAGSVLITPSENYIAFEDGVFTLKE